MDEAAWPKRGVEKREKWTCHKCNPSKNMSRSISGLSQPQPERSDQQQTSSAAQSTATPPATKKRNIDEIASPPYQIPQFDSTEDKCEYILTQLAKLMHQNEKVLEQNTRVLSELQHLREKSAADEQEILQLKTQVRDFTQKVSELEYANRALEDYTRADNLIVHGLPQAKTETEAFDMVIAVGKAVGIELTRQSLNACHALGAPRPGPGRIVCRFVHRWQRYKFQIAVNKGKPTTLELGYPGENIKIYATDHLSPQTSRLYGETKRRLAQQFGGVYEKVWVRSRKIYARRAENYPAFEIRSMDHLLSLAGHSEPSYESMEIQQGGNGS